MYRYMSIYLSIYHIYTYDIETWELPNAARVSGKFPWGPLEVRISELKFLGKFPCGPMESAKPLGAMEKGQRVLRPPPHIRTLVLAKK